MEGRGPSVSGHQGGYAIREIVNAIIYQSRTGCQRDYPPHDLPPRSAAYYCFARWRDDGTDQAIHDLLRWRLFQIEKSFRTARSDLQARPAYHRTRDSIEAHRRSCSLPWPSAGRSSTRPTGPSASSSRPPADRTIEIHAGDHTITAANPLPDDLSKITPRPGARTSLMQSGCGIVALIRSSDEIVRRLPPARTPHR
jgi:transposase